MIEPTINIRAIQHYMYCPRRFALLEVNDDWVENALVVKGNLIHERVHNSEHEFSDKEKIVKSAVSIFNDEYNIYGVSDVIEFVKAKDGIKINQFDGLYKVNIVEYKPTAPKSLQYNESDAIQVFAQKLCADYVWGCNSEGYLYYSNTKKRIRISFETEFDKYNNMILSYLENMRDILRKEYIPPRIRGQKCSGCSMRDVCFPTNKRYLVRDIIENERLI